MKTVYRLVTDLHVDLTDFVFESVEKAYEFLATEPEVQEMMADMEFVSVQEMFDTGNMMLIDMMLI